MQILTTIGTLLPFLLVGSGVVYDVKALALAGYLVGLVSPSLGHLVYRRKVTRGLVVRVVGAGIFGLAVVGVRGAAMSDGSLGMFAVCFLIAIGTFLFGCGLDLVDQAASAARSRNV